MNCKNCNEEYSEITNSKLCSDCYEMAESWKNFYPKERE